MHSKKLLPLLICVVLLGQSVGLVRAKDPAPVFEKAECLMEIPDGLKVECGTLAVPERHADPAGKQIKLYVAIIKSRHPAPDPILYLDGGPGGSGVFTLEDWVEWPLLDKYDLILLDQRGTGYSTPSLNCIELEDYNTPEDEATRACHDRLVKEGVDLGAYNSAESAADIADLRVALGYKTWNLLGISYGSRLALTVLRDHPEGVRTAILDGVDPLQVNFIEAYGPQTVGAFETLFKGCAKNAACNKAFPKLDEAFYSLVEKLDNEPVEVEGSDPVTGDPVTQEMTGYDLMNGVYQALYDSTMIPELPLMIFEAAQGDTDSLAPLIGLDTKGLQIDEGDQGDLSDSEGMGLSVNCTEEVPFNDETKAVDLAKEDPVQIRQDVIDDVRDEFAQCKIWDVPKAAAVENEPVKSDIPSLILNGEYDPVTPPMRGAAAAQYLPKSFSFIFPGLGHGATGSNDCVDGIIRAFLADPAKKPNAACIAKMGEPDFTTH